MACSFEQVLDEFQQLDRLFSELDGSFVWRGESPLGVWQVDGMLYDRQGAVQWCEIKGRCPRTNWHKLLCCFGWPQQALLAHVLDRQFFASVDNLDVLWQQ